MSTATNILTRVVLPIVLVAGGLACAGGMIALKPGADSKEAVEIARPVEVIDAKPRTLDAVIQATGTVEPTRSVSLSAEVAGKVVYMDERVRPGGTFSKGETLFRVDARDYRAALAADEARLAQAELELALERKRQLTAQREWELLGKADTQEPLALRKPHLAVAEANLKSAEAAVARSRLNVSRTSVRAPFNSVVVSETVDLGQVINSQSQLVTLVGSDSARVAVSVPVDKLEDLEIPGYNAEDGGRARIMIPRRNGGAVVHEGQITGVAGQLDAQTRTANVVVTVPDPRGAEVPLLPGSFVRVDLIGRPLDGAVPIPRQALADGDRVWLALDGRLTARDVTVGWRTTDEVYIVEGLAAGDKVVVRLPSVPVQGMLVAPTAAVAKANGEEG
ncbi:MAG: efflux RND transporter periplasmic adaptor subunit [Myxococcota bacterium]